MNLVQQCSFSIIKYRILIEYKFIQHAWTIINIWSCIYKKQWKNNWHNRLLWWLQMLCLKPCNVIISAAAYSLGANFIWFIGLILSLLIIIGVVVFIIMCRRVTKHKPPPQSKLNGKSVWQLGKGGGGCHEVCREQVLFGSLMELSVRCEVFFQGQRSLWNLKIIWAILFLHYINF